MPKKELFGLKRILYALIAIVVIGLHGFTRMHHKLPLKLVNLIDHIKLYLNEADNSHEMGRGVQDGEHM